MARLDNYSRFEDKAPELLVDLADNINAMLRQKLDIDNEKAKHLSVEISQKIAENWGGLTVYIPRNLATLLNERDFKIWQDFKGNNHAELARKYQVSIQWIYKIVNRMQKEEMARVQPDLFTE